MTLIMFHTMDECFHSGDNSNILSKIKLDAAKALTEMTSLDYFCEIFATRNIDLHEWDKYSSHHMLLFSFSSKVWANDMLHLENRIYF